MRENIIYAGVAALLLVLEIVYFKLAERWRIIDKPNERSSHSTPTIRGAGIIFPLAVVVWFATNPSWPWFLAGVILLSVISFVDDLNHVSSALRATVQGLAVAFIFYQLAIFEWPLWLMVLAFIVSVGAINAFNFMDGINGITGLYALTNIATFVFIQRYVIAFTDEALLVILSIALFIFLFFNFRIKARAFAGDVGSVTLAFIQIFLMFQLIVASNSLVWVGIVLVFGTDSVITIVFRLRKRENIFKAHRQHVFQYLSNELKLSHQVVSFIYAIVQALINCFIVFLYTKGLSVYVVLLIAVYPALFILSRALLLKKIQNTNLA
jgi:UDP-N-acetylmuramyl pentapeptide phosphotransferase/UDP-N-acetylglucosamine-1-phosphate transferase